MIVIHPYDESTRFLNLLYDKPKPDLTEENSKHEVDHLLGISKEVMILGHGTEYGLLCREGENMFGRYLIDYSHGYYLTQCTTLIGIWCNANIYAEKLGLHGLFSGMVISELSEAEDWGIKTTKEELDLENKKFASRLGGLLRDPNIRLHEIPEIFQTLDDSKTPLTKFNYENIYWI